ncbi:mitochondrial complex I protein Fmp36 [Moelleriella libera RCEF 2490]|uniref:Mitochondrial zinc maintenance protein 1, mitochondrial n=1 Tax=Moelleriella libera RCEF 2490 TaxID=1081109 RepID=A0A167W6X3_9HYPO|nr:mitochondrial complex I protein Fmp36 [Moelleriella libera RCEF 2490]
MRAARVAFRGDAPVLAAAQQQIRDGFRQKASLTPSDPDAASAIQHAQEVAKFLRSNVVQGVRLDGHDNKYQLRIHEHTERGDNDSIKVAGRAQDSAGCCGGQQDRL